MFGLRVRGVSRSRNGTALASFGPSHEAASRQGVEGVEQIPWLKVAGIGL